MAELRSFIIGVTIAVVILGAGWVIFGGGGGEGSTPSVRLLGTPPATRTQQPAATRPPAQNTPAVPTTPAGGITVVPEATETPDGEAEPTATLESAPTEEPTATPEIDTVAAYTATADPVIFSLQGQVDYLVGNTQNAAIGDPNWTNFTIQAAQTVQSLASQLSALSPPACLSGSHQTLVAGAGLASQGASQAISGAQANDATSVTTAYGSLANASSLISQGIGESQSAAC